MRLFENLSIQIPQFGPMYEIIAKEIHRIEQIAFAIPEYQPSVASLPLHYHHLGIQRARVA